MAVIKNIIQTTFTGKGAEAVVAQTQGLTKAQTRLAQTSASAGRAFSAQAQGLGGLVAAYAGAAATTFALQQAFDALARSARAAQTLSGLRNLAENAGQSSAELLNTVREITKNQLTLTEAAQQINLSLSAGFSSEQIERLGGVALKASRALGRDLTDAYTRVIRGSAKLETELLDELGIYTRIDPAVRAYAAATNKAASSLTDFERRQAFVNAVIAEGERKFKSINTTIPTTSEKIEAFGTSIIDAATKIGIFFADVIAPLAEFLTNNLAGSFGAVGLAASLVASKGVAILEGSIDKLSKRVEQRAVKINSFFLSLNKGSRIAQEEARAAISGISEARSGLVGGIGAEIKALKEVSATRKLTTEELKQATVALQKREAALRANILKDTESIAKQRASLTASKLKKAEIEALNKSLDTNNKRLEKNNSLLAATTAQLTAVGAAANRSSASLASFSSALVMGTGKAITSVIALGAGFISLAGRLIGFISIASLLGSTIANLAGKQEEYNALLEKFGAAIKGFFSPSDATKAKQGFSSLADAALVEIQKVNRELRETDSFKFKSKILFVDVEISKSKEELSKEVSSALASVARQGSVTLRENLISPASGTGAAVGAVIGAGIIGALGAFGGPVGVAVGAKIGTTVGSAIGAAVVGVAAARYKTFLDNDLPRLTAEREEQLSRLIGDSTAFEGESGKALSQTVKILDDQLGIASSLTFEGRRYLRTQIETAQAIIDNRDNILLLQSVADRLNITAEDVRDRFNAVASEIEGIDGLTLKATLDDITSDRQIQISLTFVDQASFIASLEELQTALTRDIERAFTVPGRLWGQNAATFEEALAAANRRLEEARQTVENTTTTIGISSNRIAQISNNIRSTLEDITPPDSVRTQFDSLKVSIDNLLSAPTVQNANEASAAIANFLIAARGGATGNTLTQLRNAVADLREQLRALIPELIRNAELTAALERDIEAAADAQTNLSRVFKPDDQFIEFIKQTAPKALEDLAINTENAGLALANFTNLFRNLQSEADSGTLSLDGFSQISQALTTTLDRTSISIQRAEEGLANLVRLRDEEQTRIGPDASSEALEQLNEQIEKQRQLLEERRRELATANQTFLALEDQLEPILTQLRLTEALRENFNSLLTQNNALIGLYDQQGNLIQDSAKREEERFAFLQRTYTAGAQNYKDRLAFEAQIEQIDGLSIATKSALLSVNAENSEELLSQLNLEEKQQNALENIVFLSAQQNLEAQNTRNVLGIITSEYINQITALTQITKEINEQNAALQQRIGILQAQNAVAAAQRNLERVQLDNSIAQNRAQLAIRNSQAELNKLQIAQNKAAGGGNDTKKQSLELLKSEIELRQTLSTIETEATKQRLQANLDAAQKTKEAFEEVTTFLDLTGALTGIGAILTNQLEILELERQQAEERYQNTLETLAIERQILEAQMAAASGGQKASEAIIQAELDILRQQQQLELDSQSATLRELEARSILLERQRELQIAQASIEAAKARADIQNLRTQAEQNSSFLNNKADLDDSFLDAMAKLVTEFVRAANPEAVAITADKVSRNFTEASANFEMAIADLESKTRVIFGGELADGTRVQGLIFDELETSFASSKKAIEDEIAALNERTGILVKVQELELSNAEAQLRAQQGGGADRLLELQAQLNAITAQEAQAGAERAKVVAEASRKQAEAIREFATDVIKTVGKFITAQKQARINTLLEEEGQLKDVLSFQTAALTEAQSAASNALQEEISLREKLKEATESLIETQNSYLESIGGKEGANVTEASKRFIDTLLEQKQAIFDLQSATRSRIAADSRSASLEQVQAQLTDALTLKTAQRINAEEDLKNTQERLALVTKLVSGEIGNFIKSLGSLGKTLSGLSGGGSFGQVFSNLLGFQDALSSFANIGTTFAAAANRQVSAANTQQQAAATFNNATATLTGTAPTSTTGAIASGAGGVGAAATGSVAAGSGLTFSGLVSSAFSGAGVGSLIGALTGDISWASTIGGAVGSTIATVFAGSTFVGAVTSGITAVATSAGFAAATASSIALLATPLAFAAIGALIFGALFGRKEPEPQALISGSVTGEGFETRSISSRDLSSENIRSLESIPQQVFAGFLSNFEAAGLKFQDRADVTIDFYKGEFRKIETTFSSGLSTTASNIGKSAQDAAEELERQFFRGLGADSFSVTAFTPNRENIQQALRTFGELEDLDQKTRDRFVRGLEFAQEFDGIVRNLLGTSVKVVDIFRVIDSAASSLSENKLNQYNTLLATTADNLGRNSAQYRTLEAAIRSNALSLLGLAENAGGSLVSIRELSSELNAGAIAVRNIVAETTALRSTLSGLGNVLSGINIDAAIGQALRTRLEEFVSDFGNSLNLAVSILREPARIVLVDLEKFIVNGVERIRQASGVYEQLLAEQARGIANNEPSTAELSLSLSNAGKTLSNFFKRLFNSIVPESLEVAIDESPLKTIDDLSFDQLGTLGKAAKNVATATELLGLELKGFISTISDKAQLQVIINSAEAIDEYAGAIARSAAEARLAEINEIERTQATQQFNKISREFTKRLREITKAAGGLTIGGEGVSFIDILDAFGTTEIDQASREFKSYLDLINSGSNISSNFNSAISFLNQRFDNGESDSLKFVSALELLQRVTLQTVDSIGDLVDAYESTLQQISEAFNSARSDLLESVKSLSSELVSLIKNVSDKSQEILGIFDDAVRSVTETGNAIFDLRDAAKDAFTSAADAVSEFEKANKLSGRSSAQVRAELENVSAQIANTLGSQTFNLGSFFELSSLTTSQSALQRELKRLGATESEYEKLISVRTQASEDLAFVESKITNLSGNLTDARSTESKLIQDTRKAVQDYTSAQVTLAEVTNILSEQNFDLTKTRIDETSAIIKLNNAINELNRDTIKLDEIVADILATADNTLRDSFIEGAITSVAAELDKLSAAAKNLFINGATSEVANQIAGLDSTARAAFVNGANSKLAEQIKGLDGAARNAAIQAALTSVTGELAGLDSTARAAFVNGALASVTGELAGLDKQSKTVFLEGAISAVANQIAGLDSTARAAFVNGANSKLAEQIKGLDGAARDAAIQAALTSVTGELAGLDSTARAAFVNGAIASVTGELAGLDQRIRQNEIAKLRAEAGLTFDRLNALAISLKGVADGTTVLTMSEVEAIVNNTIDTFEEIISVFSPEKTTLVKDFANQINRYADISTSIDSVAGLRSQITSLSSNSQKSAANVAILVSDLVSLQNQLQTLSGDSGVDSLRQVFKGLAQDLQRAWDQNVILGLPNVINLKAISVAPDGGLNELKTIATNSNKFAYIKAVGAAGMEQAVFRAEGGYVSGPGTSTSDSIPAYLSDGEYVIKASTVRKVGLNLLNQLNASGDLDEAISYQGRFGDTIAAHINTAEMQLLKELGGSGTRNPVTGMLEFFGGASSGANAYGGLFAEQEAAYVKKIQDKFPSGNPQMRSSFKANYIDTRKLQDTYFNTVGTPIDLLGKGGNDIMDTAGYDSMQNQMLSSTMILDSLAGKRGLEGVTSQTQGFGTDSYNAPAPKSFFESLFGFLGALLVGLLTFGLGAPLAVAALATAGTGLAINEATAAKASEMQGKDLQALFAGVTAQDLGRGGYDIKNSPVNKILANGNTIATDQSNLGTRQNTFFSKMLGGGANAANPKSIVDEYNKKNDKFFDFYMLNDPKIPNFVKPSYTAKNNSTGGLVNALNTSANLLGTNISGQRDSIPAMLEPGEFVLRKPAVDRMGLDTAIRLNSTGNVENDVNVEVNVINNSSPVTPTIQQTRRENGKIVVDVILEDIRNNGPIRQSLKGIK